MIPGFKEETKTPEIDSAVSAEGAAATVEEPKPGEAEKSEATTATEDPHTEQQTTDPEGQEEDDFEPGVSTLGPKELASKIEANPAVKAALDASPELRDMVFANARLAAKAKPYVDMFGSPEEAKVVNESHQAFVGIRNLLGAVKKGDLQSTHAVISAMLEQDAMRDEDGNPKKDAQGRLVTGGTTGRFLQNALNMRLASLEAQAKDVGDNETLAALDLVMERLGLRAPSSADEDGMSEELKAQKAELEQQQRELDEQRAQGRKEAQSQHDQRVFSRIDGALDKGISSILDGATGLTPFTRSNVERDIRAAMRSAIKSSSTFQMELDRIERMPVGAKRENAHVVLAQRYIHSYLRKLANPILAEAGITVQKAAAQKQQTQAARAENARSEVGGSGTPSHTTAKPSTEQNTAQIRADLTQKLGREPNLQEMLAAQIAPAFA